MEITNEILFEEHAAVYENAAHEIADHMNIPLDSVELVSGMKIGCLGAHLLKITAKNSTTGTVIYDDEIATIPVWPPPVELIQKIKTALTVI